MQEGEEPSKTTGKSERVMKWREDVRAVGAVGEVVKVVERGLCCFCSVGRRVAMLRKEGERRRGGKVVENEPEEAA